MTKLGLDKGKLADEHLRERRSVLLAEIQAWYQLRTEHKQAIQKNGLIYFTAWNEQRKNVQNLSIKLRLIRVEMNNRQQKELDE